MVGAAVVADRGICKVGHINSRTWTRRWMAAGGGVDRGRRGNGKIAGGQRGTAIVSSEGS